MYVKCNGLTDHHTHTHIIIIITDQRETTQHIKQPSRETSTTKAYENATIQKDKVIPHIVEVMEVGRALILGKSQVCPSARRGRVKMLTECGSTKSPDRAAGR